MKALTCWQPWASLIAIGAKPYEFRGWRPPSRLIGKRLAIHAGARPMRRVELDYLLLKLDDSARPLCLLPSLARPLLQRAVASLKDNGAPLFGEEPVRLPFLSIVCTVVVGEPKRGDLCAREFAARHDPDGYDGAYNWGWPMLDVKSVGPTEVAGQSGLWDVPHGLLSENVTHS